MKRLNNILSSKYRTFERKVIHTHTQIYIYIYIFIYKKCIGATNKTAPNMISHSSQFAATTSHTFSHSSIDSSLKGMKVTFQIKISFDVQPFLQLYVCRFVAFNIISLFILYIFQFDSKVPER